MYNSQGIAQGNLSHPGEGRQRLEAALVLRCSRLLRCHARLRGKLLSLYLLHVMICFLHGNLHAFILSVNAATGAALPLRLSDMRVQGMHTSIS